MKTFLVDLYHDRISPSSENHIRSTVIGNYSIKPEEVEGEVVNWALQYLEQKKCPVVLNLAIAKYVAEQMKDLVKNENKVNGGIQNTGCANTIDAVHFHSQAIEQLHVLCGDWVQHPDQLMAHTANIKGDPYFTSVCTIKNVRRKMEDRYTVIHNLNLICGLKDAPHHSYYGVFDGHAGTRAANYAAAHLHSNIAHHPAFLSDPVTAIKEGFKLADEQVIEKSKEENTKSGCTVVCSFLNDTALHVAWVGDSQAILVRQGIPYIITNPHKPDRKDERERIEDLDGCVLFIGTWRVNGTLAVSRALGDPDHKPYVSAEPDVVTIPLEGNEDFFVLACDGLWDRLNPSDVASAIYSYIVEHPPNDYDEVASRLVLQAKEHGSDDNITAIVIFFKDPKELAANPKNPPPYALQLNGLKVDNWCQGSWNGEHEDGNSDFVHYCHSENAVKPNSLGGLSKPDDIDSIHQIRNFQFSPVACEVKGSFEISESKNSCQSNVNSVMPEATAFSELPTPPIDELLASQQFDEQDKLIQDTLSIVETAEIKPSCVTLVDSGILEQEYVQCKKSDPALHDINVIPVSSCSDSKDELLSTNTTIEIASEIVSNAIELAVNQVMVRTSSEMSQNFDDSGLDEGPLEESDASPVSASPEFDEKPATGLQDMMSFDNEEPCGVPDNVNSKSEDASHIQKECSGQSFGIQQIDLISECNQLTEELASVQISEVSKSANSNHRNETCQNLIEFNHSDINKVKDIASENVLHQDDAFPQTIDGNLLESENFTVNTSLPHVMEPTTSTPDKGKERIMDVEGTSAIVSEESNGILQVIGIVGSSNTEGVSPIVDNSSLQPSSEKLKSSFSSSSLLPSEVDQLFKQLADEDTVLPATLSNTLPEELQVGVTPIDLVAIPDEVPEAEGVTEDSDSEKDGGWSYIQGGKTEIGKQQKADHAVSGKTLNTTNKKPLNKVAAKKEPTKGVAEVKTSQLKPSTISRNKVLPEKIDSKTKTLHGTLKATKPPSRTAAMVDRTKKTSSVPSKPALQISKSTESATLRPNSSIKPTGKLLPSRTNTAVTQKASTTTVAASRQVKSAEQKVASKTATAVSSTTTSTTTARKTTTSKALTSTVQRVTTKTVSSQVGLTGSTTQPRVRAPPLKPASSTTKSSPKSTQDAKQTKESTNKQISSRPSSSITKTKVQTESKNPLASQISLHSRAQVSSNPTTSKLSTSFPKPPLAKNQKLVATTSRPNMMKNKAASTESSLKLAKNKQKSIEKPADLRRQSSEQEKGTKEELTKEIVSPAEETSLKQASNQSHIVETEVENESIQK